MTFHTNLNTAHPPPAPNPAPTEPHPKLPTTPWQHTRHWLSTSAGTPRGTRISGTQRNSVSPNGIGSTVLDGWRYQLDWRLHAEQRRDRQQRLVARGVRSRLSDELARVTHVEFLAPSALDDSQSIRLADLLAGVDNVLYAPPPPAIPGCRVGVPAIPRGATLAAAMVASIGQPKLFF